MIRQFHKCSGIPMFRNVGKDTDGTWYFINEINGITDKINYCPFCGEKLQ